MTQKYLGSGKGSKSGGIAPGAFSRLGERSQRAVRRQLSLQGSKGGHRKSRGDSEYYRTLSLKGVEVRRENRRQALQEMSNNA